MVAQTSTHKSPKQLLVATFWMALGAFLAAYSLEVFLVPNNIIDGGVIGISILLGKLFGEHLIYPLVLILNIPFVIIAFRSLGRTLVIQMILALIAFAAFGVWIARSPLPVFGHYTGDLLEIVVIGGLILGLGVGLIIRAGGCLDGTEIMGLYINKRLGMSVGNVVLAANTVIFGFAGFVFGDWHPPIQSLITFFVVIKIMDMVIVGLDEMKSVMILSSESRPIADRLLHDMGLGLTVIEARGGYTDEKRDVLYMIAERLQLAEIKAIAHSLDPKAVVAIENLHEVATTNPGAVTSKTQPARS